MGAARPTTFPSASAASERRRTRSVVRGQRIAAAVALVGALAFAAALRLGDDPSLPDRVELRLGERPVAVVPLLDQDGGRRPATAIARGLPRTVRVKRSGVRTRYAIDRGATAAALASTSSATLVPPARAVEVSIDAPVVAQQLRNNCETAALEVLLATTGVRVDQMTLQGRLRRSGSPDPVSDPSGPTWGDPDAGYVGRADGTGTAGGFGVYPRPVAELAARYGRRLKVMEGASPESVYAHLRVGHAVQAWVGLDDGPYRTWRTAAGKAITVNLNEHTVVLSGIRADGSLEVVNVLGGTREVWSRARFERDFDLLGGRALAV